MKKVQNKFKIEEKISVLVTLIFVVIISSMTIGFAFYSRSLNIGGNYVMKKIGRVEITRISYITGTNVQNYSNPPEFDGLSAEFNMTFKKTTSSNNFNITYEIEVHNGYYKDYIFRGLDFNPSVTAQKNNTSGDLTFELDGVVNGDVLHAGESKIFRLTFILDASDTSGTYVAGADTEVDTTKQTEDEGVLRASISPNTCDLSGDNEKCSFNLDVINTFSYDRDFTLISSNSNFKFVDENNNPLSTLTISANGEQNYTFYMTQVNNAIFLSETATSTVFLSSNGIANVSAGNVNFTVDVYAAEDDQKVVVSNAKLNWARTNNKRDTGKIIATWDRDDEGGSDVVNYRAYLYKTTDTSNYYKYCDTNSAVQSCNFENVDDATYYIIVYGEDRAENSGADSVSTATTSAGYATKSPNATFKWRYTVTFSLSHLKAASGSSSTAYLDQDYQVTIERDGLGYYVPSYGSDFTVTMGGKKLTSGTDYTYTSTSTSNGKITVYNVSGNITVTATADGGGLCLAEGTKVLLANGKYKNIENIDYDDLLLVYSYETGDFVPIYPAWIEKKHQSKEYQLITFSDGSTLKTVGGHGLYDMKLKQFVSVADMDVFNVGSKIAKMNKDRNGFEEVTVTNIENINKVVNYYHVVSTRYYNIITDDFLTTDDAVILSNLYGFNDDITWPKEIRNEAMKDVYTYDELKDTIPYYMFKSLRAEEGKILANYGFDLDMFKGYLYNNQMNPELLKEPIKKFGKNLWMVTTSENNITDLNKNNYLLLEGSIYTLPKSKKKNFIGWLNTTENKIYNPGDKVTIYCGTHFIALYK